MAFTCGVGFINYTRAFCFALVVLQAMVHSPTLFESVELDWIEGEGGKCLTSCNHEADKWCWLCETMALVRRARLLLSDGTYPAAIYPGRWGKMLHLSHPPFDAKIQDDAALLFQALCGKFDERAQPGTFMEYQYKFKIQTTIESQSCSCARTPHSNDTPILIVSLPWQTDMITIENLLHQCLNTPIRAQHGTRCSSCGNRYQSGCIMRRITDSPVDLVVQLTRFHEEGAKVNTPVGFEEELDLSPFCEAALASLKPRGRLYAIIEHKGDTISYGHFVAWVKGADGRWYQKDDELIMVPKRGFSSVKCCAQPYMLFYSVVLEGMDVAN